MLNKKKSILFITLLAFVFVTASFFQTFSNFNEEDNILDLKNKNVFAQPFSTLSQDSYALYNNSKLGIWFRYPSNWTITEDLESNKVTLYPSDSLHYLKYINETFLPEPVGFDYTYDINLIKQKVEITVMPSYNVTLNEWTSIIANKHQNASLHGPSYLGTEEPTEESSLIKGHPSTSISYSNSTTDMRDFLLVTNNNLVYITVVYGHTLSLAPNFENNVEEILGSLTVNNATKIDEQQSNLKVSHTLKLNRDPTDGEENPQIVVSEDNNFVYAFWRDYSDERLLFTRSIDSGTTFGDQIFLDNGEGKTEGLKVGIFKKYLHAVWEDGEDIAYIKSGNNGGSFNKEITLSNQSNSSEEPNIAVVKNNVYIVWHDDNSILFTRSNDNGATFEKPVHLYVSNDTSGPIVKTSNNGSVYVSWFEPNSGKVFFTKSVDSGATFEQPINPFGNIGCTRNLDLAASQDSIYVTCVTEGVKEFEGEVEGTRFETEYQIVLFTRSIDGGNSFDITYSFAAPERGPQVMSGPFLASSDNNVYVLWSGKSYKNWLASDRDAAHIFLKRSPDNGTSFYEVDDLTPGLSVDAFASDIASYKNKVYVAWEEVVDETNDISSNSWSDIILASSNNDGELFDEKAILNPYREFSRDTEVETTNFSQSIYAIWVTGEERPSYGNISLAEIIDKGDDKNKDKSYNPVNNTVIDSDNGNNTRLVMYDNTTSLYSTLESTRGTDNTSRSSSIFDNVFLSSNKTNVTSNAKNFTTYRDDFMQFVYPIDWEKEDRKSSRITLTHLSPEYGEVEVRTEDLSPTVIDLAQYLAKYNVTKYLDFEVIKDLEYYNVTLGGYPAVQIRSVGLQSEDDNQTQSTLIDIITIVQNRLFEIRYYYSSAEAKEHQDNHMSGIQNLIESFKILTNMLKHK